MSETSYASVLSLFPIGLCIFTKRRLSTLSVGIVAEAVKECELKCDRLKLR